MIRQTETLLTYDCDLLFLAQDLEGQTYIVSHTGECGGNCEFIAVPVCQESLSGYMAGSTDLRDLMLVGGRETWYSARPAGNPGELALEHQETPLSESPDLPSEGFHHNPYFRKHVEDRTHPPGGSTGTQ